MEKYRSLKGYRDSEGKFTQLPGKRQKAKLDLMLQFLAEKFEAGKLYSESEINDLLNMHHSFNDPATLRRMLLGIGVLERRVDGRAYWLV